MPRATLFGQPTPQIIDPKRKRKLMELARRAVHSESLDPSLDRLTGTHVLVYEALLWRFHRNSSARCFPSLETIARWVGCAVDTVCEALKRLERIGLITWHHRIRRVLAPSLDPAATSPTRSRVLRTSNAYHFTAPSTKLGRPRPTKASSEAKQRGPRNPLIEKFHVRRQQTANEFLPIGNWIKERVLAAIAKRKEHPS